MTDRPTNDGGDRPEVAEEVHKASIPLNTCDPHAPLNDLEPIREVFADATVVGMGEHSHGTRDVFQFKHRLFRFLVEELDYRLFAIEASFAATLSINEYIVEGTGSAREVVYSDNIHKIWHCDSVIELVEWAREFNKGRDYGDKIRFFGIDIQPQEPMIAEVESYLERVDPDLLATHEKELAYLQISPASGSAEDESELHRYVDTIQTVVSTLEKTLASNKAKYLEYASQSAYQRIAIQLELLSKLGKMGEAHLAGDLDTVMKLRGEGMANTVSWIRETAPTDRIAIWAHNAHIKRGEYLFPAYDPEDVPALGEHLTRASDIDYVPVGFSVAHGEARVIFREDQEFGVVNSPDPPSGSMPAVLSASFDELRLVFFEELSDSGPAAEWCQGEPQRHYITGHYEDGPIDYVRSDPRSDFDIIVFVPEGVAARDTT